MLVLSRKKREGICVGSSIQITVLAIEGKKVRLGFEAPQDVPIVRAELEHWSFSEDSDHARQRNCDHVATSAK